MHVMMGGEASRGWMQLEAGVGARLRMVGARLDAAHEDAVRQAELLVNALIEIKAQALEQLRLKRHCGAND